MGNPAANAARTTLHLDRNQHHDLQPASANHPARATTNTAIAAPEPPVRRQAGARSKGMRAVADTAIPGPTHRVVRHAAKLTHGYLAPTHTHLPLIALRV